MAPGRLAQVAAAVDQLQELAALQIERGEQSPFADALAFKRWADEVLPRLDFDKRLAADFRNAVATAETHRALGLSADDAINEAIGVLNRAVVAYRHAARHDSKRGYQVAKRESEEEAGGQKQPASQLVQLAYVVAGTVLATMVGYLIRLHFGISL